MSRIAQGQSEQRMLTSHRDCKQYKSIPRDLSPNQTLDEFDVPHVFTFRDIRNDSYHTSDNWSFILNAILGVLAYQEDQ